MDAKLTTLWRGQDRMYAKLATIVDGRDIHEESYSRVVYSWFLTLGSSIDGRSRDLSLLGAEQYLRKENEILTHIMGRFNEVVM